MVTQFALFAGSRYSQDSTERFSAMLVARSAKIAGGRFPSMRTVAAHVKSATRAYERTSVRRTAVGARGEGNY